MNPTTEKTQSLKARGRALLREHEAICMAYHKAATYEEKDSLLERAEAWINARTDEDWQAIVTAELDD